jgi:hypothetical protein
VFLFPLNQDNTSTRQSSVVAVKGIILIKQKRPAKNRAQLL